MPLECIEAQREEYYKKLGTPPGVPTMKGNYVDPENTGVGYNTVISFDLHFRLRRGIFYVIYLSTKVCPIVR